MSNKDDLEPEDKPQAVSEKDEVNPDKRNIFTALLLMLHGSQFSRELTPEEEALQKALEPKVDVEYDSWSWDAW